MSIKDKLRAANTEARESAKRHAEELEKRKRAAREDFRRLTPMVCEVLDELGIELFGKSLGMLRRHRIRISQNPDLMQWTLELNDRGLRLKENRRGWWYGRPLYVCLHSHGDSLLFEVKKIRDVGYSNSAYSTDLSREALEEALVEVLRARQSVD